MAYGDGPPYSEDDDLHSPVVASRHHKKQKSGPRSGKRRSPGDNGLEEEDDPNLLGSQRSYFAGINGDGTETYYIGEEDESANSPRGELVTYPPDPASQSLLAPKAFGDSQRASRDSHFAAGLPSRSFDQVSDDGSGFLDPDDSRYSRDYQFTIASPDEEMHGKAVALFDFARENENELPLIEGQIIWVSYRHGQGWLVAEDPKTGDAGLVPEEYVRLLRDIEGGWSSLSGEEVQLPAATAMEESDLASPITAPTAFNKTDINITDTVATPTQPDSGHDHHFHHGSNDSNGGKGDKRPPIVSTFSTSSKDLDLYPHHLLGQQAGATPPTIVHQGSQSNTPTVTSPSSGSKPPTLGGVEEVEENGDERAGKVSQEVGREEGEKR